MLKEVSDIQAATSPVPGRIVKIIKDSGSQTAFVILDIFHVGLTCHAWFGLPILTRRFGESTILVVSSPVCYLP
jgi:hypothetical protein